MRDNFIKEETIEEVKSKTDLVALISEHIILKKVGTNWKAVCPFHKEKTPSLIVSPQKQIYKCFGCGEGGNAFSFLMKYQNMSFKQAIIYLGERSGMDTSIFYNAGKKITEERKKRNDIYDALEKATDFFYSQISNSEKVKDYIKKRDINKETVEKFKVGYAPPGNSLLSILEDFDIELLKEASLVEISEKTGEPYSYFRDRIIFPIYDSFGKIAGFSGRVIGDGKPKYLNSHESRIFKKRELLYGLDKARNAIREQGCAVMMEGYTDVLTAHQKGIKNCIGTGGTALTSDHARIIKSNTGKVVLCFDNDFAGIKAALRGGGELLKQDLETRLMLLPEGQDPDDFIKQNNPEEFGKLVEESKPLFEFKLNRLKNEIKERKFADDDARILKEMLPFIDKTKTILKQQAYIGKLSKEFNIEKKYIIQALKNYKLNERIIIDLEEKPDRFEEEILQIMLRWPDYSKYIDSHIKKGCFENPYLKAVYSYISENNNSAKLQELNLLSREASGLFNNPIQKKIIGEIIKYGKKKKIELNEERLNSLIGKVLFKDEKTDLERIEFLTDIIKTRYKEREKKDIQKKITSLKDPDEISQLLDKYLEVLNL